MCFEIRSNRFRRRVWSGCSDWNPWLHYHTTMIQVRLMVLRLCKIDISIDRFMKDSRLPCFVRGPPITSGAALILRINTWSSIQQLKCCLTTVSWSVASLQFFLRSCSTRLCLLNWKLEVHVLLCRLFSLAAPLIKLDSSCVLPFHQANSQLVRCPCSVITIVGIE